MSAGKKCASGKVVLPFDMMVKALEHLPNVQAAAIRVHDDLDVTEAEASRLAKD